MMYEAVTRGIKISVHSDFVEDQSTPSQNHYVWAYTIRINNESQEIVKLRTRQWHITNANGHTETIHGEGVVGEQPVLRPGEGFVYTSGAPLNTPSGLMVGRYGVETEGGEAFQVQIPAFSLDSPHETHAFN